MSVTMFAFPLSARLRSPFVSVSSIRVTMMSFPIVVRAFVGPRPVYSRVHCTTAFEIAADSSPSTVLNGQMPFCPLWRQCHARKEEGEGEPDERPQKAISDLAL